jgi:hypothetical protein
MVLKVKTDPNCPGAGIAPDDASLTNWDLNSKATTNNPRLKFSLSSIPKDRWNEIFKGKSK